MVPPHIKAGLATKGMVAAHPNLYGWQLASSGQASGACAGDATSVVAASIQKESATGKAKGQGGAKSDAGGHSAGPKAKPVPRHHGRSSNADRMEDARNDAKP